MFFFRAVVIKVGPNAPAVWYHKNKIILIKTIIRGAILK